MANGISTFILVILIFSPFALIIWWAVWFSRKQRIKAWQQMLQIADALNIPFPSPDEKTMRSNIPSISGNSKGRGFSIYQVIKGSGKSRSYYTTFRWDMTLHEAQTINLYRENFFTRMGSIIGLKDVQTGFEGFDKKFILIASDPNFALKVFSNDICNMMEDAHGAFRATINLNNNRIEYSEQGIIIHDKNRERILKLILASRALAEKAEKGSGGRG